MLCQNCGQRQATVQVTRTVKGQGQVDLLCDRCAAATGQASDPWWESLMGSILPGPSLFGYPAAAGSSRKEPAGLVCPSCGETERELRHTGLLGCARCYVTFAAVLEPVFRRVQGHTRHLTRPEIKDIPDAVTTLRNQLDAAIREEAYEEAAKIRDRIRNLEQTGEGED